MRLHSQPPFATACALSTALLLAISPATAQTLRPVAAKSADPRNLAVQRADPGRLLLSSGQFDPRTERLVHGKDWDRGLPGKWIVQFHAEQITQARTRLVAAGATILSYLPNNAYLVASSSDQERLWSIAGVRAVTPLSTGMKLAPSLLTAQTDKDGSGGSSRLAILGFPGTDPA